jgi:hypothetical protein
LFVREEKEKEKIVGGKNERKNRKKK